MMQPLTIDEFNTLWKAHKREKGKAIHLHHVGGFSITKRLNKTVVEDRVDANGIPYQVRKVTQGREVPDMNGLNKAIVAWLQLFTNPIKAEITNTTGRYIPEVGFVPNRERGRADITAQYPTFELCIETKQRNEKQLKSQQRFEAMTQQQAFRRYVLVRSWDDFQMQMIEMFRDELAAHS
jgi:hypothetical protein